MYQPDGSKQQSYYDFLFPGSSPTTDDTNNSSTFNDSNTSNYNPTKFHDSASQTESMTSVSLVSSIDMAPIMKFNDPTARIELVTLVSSTDVAPISESTKTRGFDSNMIFGEEPILVVRTEEDSNINNREKGSAAVKSSRWSLWGSSTQTVPEEKPKLEDLQRDVESLKEMFVNVSAAVHEQDERLNQVEDRFEHADMGNGIVQAEVKKAESWADLLYNNKIIVGAITVVSTVVVVVPVVATLLLKTKQKEPE